MTTTTARDMLLRVPHPAGPTSDGYCFPLESL
jgi:hypothetical protein